MDQCSGAVCAQPSSWSGNEGGNIVLPACECSQGKHRDLASLSLTDKFKPGLNLHFKDNFVIVVLLLYFFLDPMPSVPSVIPAFGFFASSQAIQGKGAGSAKKKTI